jgi:Clostripain family
VSSGDWLAGPTARHINALASIPKELSVATNAPKPPRTWTVLVYMAAGDSVALDANAVRDLQEMERATIGDDIAVVVQINRAWPKQPQRYRISSGGSHLEVPNVPDENMGDGTTLLNFLTWAAGAYPADKFFLILWGHAYGLGFGRDHGDGLTLSELTATLGKFQTLREKKLELLGANACAMSYLEAAFELREAVLYLVASQISVPFAGWPYDSILSRVKSANDGRELGEIIVARYVNDVSPSSDDRIALTLLDLSKANGLEDLVKTLTSAITDVIREPVRSAVDRLSQIRTAFMATVAGDIRPLVDAVDLCDELMAMCDDLSDLEAREVTSLRSDTPLWQLNAAAAALREHLNPRDKDRKDKFIVEHRRHPELAELNGVGIFAPFISSQADLERIGLADTEESKGRTEYNKLGLTKDAGWADLVFDRLRAGLPSDVVACIECAGPTDREDRSAVTQMLASVDSMFTRLDRTLAAAKLRIVGQLESKGAGLVLGGAAGDPVDAAGRFGELQLIGEEILDKLLKAATVATAAGPAKSPPEDQPANDAKEASQKVKKAPASPEVIQHTIDALRKMEEDLGDVERAVRHTLTNGTFGLGPGLLPISAPFKIGLGLDPKAGMGLDPKAGMGLDPKAGMGLDPKAGMGDETAFSPISIKSSPGAAVAILFGQMGQALRQLEEAAADIETLAAKALSGTLGATGLAEERARTIAVAQIDRRFKALFDAATDARRALRRILAHPAYGFGRGPVTIGAEDRRELARIGGLNSQVLRLL